MNTIKKKFTDLTPITVADLKAVLETVPDHYKVEQATDEEGNSYSPCVLRGISQDPNAKTLTFYPVLVRM